MSPSILVTVVMMMKILGVIATAIPQGGVQQQCLGA
jgi:hypothetical protein